MSKPKYKSKSTFYLKMAIFAMSRENARSFKKLSTFFLYNNISSGNIFFFTKFAFREKHGSYIFSNKLIFKVAWYLNRLSGALKSAPL